MREHPNKRTLDELEQMIKDIQYFLDHPRTQQNRWVAKGTTWIPLLKHIREELRSEVEYYALITDAYQSIWLMLRRMGLELYQRDRTTWAYSWNGADRVGAFSSRIEALEAALRQKIKPHLT